MPTPSWTIALLVLASLLMSSPAFAQVAIDDFSDDQGPITLTSAGTTNDSTTGTMIGGEREI
ncbi:MAG: hypothetical protein R3324_17960, partial [Halobacteriales archaeon]|nr:hypothetical protein [Halobacteriales archaeon]